MALLAEWAREPSYQQAFRKLLDVYAESRLRRLCSLLPADQTNFERGAIAALTEVAALPETILTKENERVKRERDASELAASKRDISLWCGSPYLPK